MVKLSVDPSEHVCVSARIAHPGSLPCVLSFLSTPAIGSAKTFVWVFLLDVTETPKQTVWPTQYTAGEACVLSLCDPMDCSPPASPLSMGFSRLEYCSGLSCPPPWDLPNPGIQPRSPTLQADSLLLSHQGNPGEAYG